MENITDAIDKRTSHDMSRGSYFGIGLGIILISLFWCFFCFVWFIGLAVGRDSVPGASVFDSSFITLYVVWGSVFLGCLWGAVRCFRSALRPPARHAPSVAQPVS